MNTTASRQTEMKQPNRREFLYYLGGASLLLLTGEAAIGLSKFLNPPPVYGERSGVYKVYLNDIPQTNVAPKPFRLGHYWLVNTSAGMIALDGWCTAHQKTVLYNWVSTNYRYECPQCGSKFQINGTWIEGSARRNLDQFSIEVTSDKGTITTPPDGSPISIEGALQIVVNSINIIQGKPRPLTISEH